MKNELQSGFFKTSYIGKLIKAELKHVNKIFFQEQSFQ